MGAFALSAHSRASQKAVSGAGRGRNTIRSINHLCSVFFLWSVSGLQSL